MKTISKEIYDGFEEKKLSDIWANWRFEPEAVKLQSKIVRGGKQAVKITVHRGDKAEIGNKGNRTERDELLERKEIGPKEGKSYSYSFSIYLPKNFPIVPVRLVLAQWKQQEHKTSSVTNPILALRYKNGVFFITLQTTEEKIRLFQIKKEIRGKWIDFVFHVKFTRTKSGFVRAWINKKEIINYKGITAYSEKQGYPKPGKFYFKMGLYRNRMNKPMTAYFDEFRKRG